MRIQPNSAVLSVLDVQGSVAERLEGSVLLRTHMGLLIDSFFCLQLPVLWVEQSPELLGATVADLAQKLAALPVIKKHTFSAFGSAEFSERLNALGRTQLVLCGLEAHVCIYQTALDAMDKGYEVFVVCDAVAAQRAHNTELALSNLQRYGAHLVTTEMLVFSAIDGAAHPQFKPLLSLFKQARAQLMTHKCGR